MLPPFPNTVRVEVPAAVANNLLAAAEGLPVYDNKEFYSTEVQQAVHEHIRETCWDEFDWLTDQIAERFRRRPYCALVHGLRFDEGNRLFVGLNRAFGELVARPYEKPRAQLVQYIQPSTDITSARGGRESERLHTDTADWPTPVELISMVCVRADPNGGGRSRILDVNSVRHEVKSRLGNDTLAELETELVPWQLASYCGGGVKWRTVLTESSMCWRRYTINLAMEAEGAKLSNDMLSLLDAFEKVISSTPRTLDYLMQEGELLFSDNRRTVHARTPVTNGDASSRLMIRSWIRTS